ncbi:acylphosphatase [Sporolactobacillus shoreicorticis]|uniref:Acylphosphatase n=1 Tax=Sporolactobacillus shoreicorticis TaxID=1923877 RepID=A0ABW5S3R6_9BACL|nr:acylphosphatase [Sporolactobacillus shoreicorticis]MCO7124402.1 acylphosphatase [Sporolactobacillus shoreicorticis]
MNRELGKMRSVELILSGRVQGVGFRYFTKQLAAQYHINGWVRNKDDGRVEIAAEGTNHQINQFIQAIGRGNFLAKIRDMDIHDFEPGHYTSFDIRATV